VKKKKKAYNSKLRIPFMSIPAQVNSILHTVDKIEKNEGQMEKITSYKEKEQLWRPRERSEWKEHINIFWRKFSLII
jgi:phosphoketolase